MHVPFDAGVGPRTCAGSLRPRRTGMEDSNRAVSDYLSNHRLRGLSQSFRMDLLVCQKSKGRGGGENADIADNANNADIGARPKDQSGLSAIGRARG